jgi:hypothetical protein
MIFLVLIVKTDTFAKESIIKWNGHLMIFLVPIAKTVTSAKENIIKCNL